MTDSRSRVRTVFEGRIFTVQVESITLPNGHALDAEIVRHPGSVAIVPLTAAGEVLLVRQYRHAAGRYTWELPAGNTSTPPLDLGTDHRSGKFPQQVSVVLTIVRAR